MSSAVTGKSMTMSVEGALLAESQNFAIHFSANTIDVTNRDSSWHGEYLVGRDEWTVDFDGLFIYNDLAKKYLQYYWSDRTPATLTIVITMPDTSTYTGEAILTSLDYEGPFEDALKLSGSLQGTAVLTASAS